MGKNMFCPNCEREVKEANFCPYCGNRLYIKRESLNNQTDDYVDEVENRSNKAILGSVIGIVIVVLITLIVIFGRNQTISDEEIKNLIKTITTTSIGDATLTFETNEIDIISKEVDTSDDITKVLCDITMSNNAMEADVEYCVFCKEEDGSWHILDSYVNTVYDVRPLQGFNVESVDFVENAIHGFYTEINWGYHQINLLGNDINYDFPISFDMTERNTDLENKKDQLVYEYEFATNTAFITGCFEYNCEFTDEGVWKLASVTQRNSNVEWNVEGVWSFDIFTYYIDVYIVNMDFENHTAEIQKRGSAFQGYGTMDTIYVGFKEEGNCLYFDTFIIPSDSIFGTDKEITLIAKLDDLYYESPSYVAGFEVGIGGKNTAY